MARPLYTRLVRETSVTVNGTPLVIAVEPSGLIGFRLKGQRVFIYLSIENCFRMALSEHRQSQRITTQNVHLTPSEGERSTPRPKRVAQTPNYENLLLEMIERQHKPAHITGLRWKWSREVKEGPAMKEILKLLKEKGKIEQIDAFSYQTVTHAVK